MKKLFFLFFLCFLSINIYAQKDTEGQFVEEIKVSENSTLASIQTPLQKGLSNGFDACFWYLILTLCVFNLKTEALSCFKDNDPSLENLTKVVKIIFKSILTMPLVLVLFLGHSLFVQEIITARELILLVLPSVFAFVILSFVTMFLFYFTRKKIQKRDINNVNKNPAK